MVALNWHTNLVTYEIEASNGYIHTIDNVLLLPPLLTIHLKHFPLRFGLANLALKRTGLDAVVNTLNGVTVFVPTNSAFLKLGLKTLHYLFSDAGIPALTSVSW